MFVKTTRRIKCGKYCDSVIMRSPVSQSPHWALRSRISVRISLLAQLKNNFLAI